ncbi:MAG: hypothetical protein A2Y38_13945 [Spirochaetes bacterium GWB1_59_5]|nr:MAG: hypothetical protein A2Y38_13945 [Spirochaetes bacterium GWB1_59_5]
MPALRIGAFDVLDCHFVGVAKGPFDDYPAELQLGIMSSRDSAETGFTIRMTARGLEQHIRNCQRILEEIDGE